jgi:hypothetical protein
VAVPHLLHPPLPPQQAQTRSQALVRPLGLKTVFCRSLSERQVRLCSVSKGQNLAGKGCRLRFDQQVSRSSLEGFFMFEIRDLEKEFGREVRTSSAATTIIAMNLTSYIHTLFVII